MRFVNFSAIVMVASLFCSQALGDTHESSGQQFAGLKFGVGLSLTTNSSARSRVKAAEVIDGITRVTFERNSVARIMLESHFFFTPQRKDNKTFFGLKNNNWGIGPFVAIQPGSEEIIESIGAGLLMGFKRDDAKDSSWNIGFGIVVDPNVTVLGDGFNENEPPPGLESQVRLKSTSAQGFLILTSFSF